MSMVSISCDADREYIEALKLVAKRHGVKLGTLVRRAIDQSHSGEIAEAQRAAASFFAPSGASTFQVEYERK